MWRRMEDDVVKAHLHQKLREACEALVWKLDGLSEYDIRRPMTATGTNLLGLVKHNVDVGRPVLRRGLRPSLPREPAPVGRSGRRGPITGRPRTRARVEIVDLYRRVSTHADATIDLFDLARLGRVPWWDEEVPLLNVMAARLVDAVRHAGHADILRELLDGSVGEHFAHSLPLHGRDHAYWEARRGGIEDAARAAPQMDA